MPSFLAAVNSTFTFLIMTSRLLYLLKPLCSFLASYSFQNSQPEIGQCVCGWVGGGAGWVQAQALKNYVCGFSNVEAATSKSVILACDRSLGQYRHETPAVYKCSYTLPSFFFSSEVLFGSRARPFKVSKSVNK